MANPNIVWFQGLREENLLIGVDRREVATIFSQVEPAMVLGEDPQHISILYMKWGGEEKPIRVRGTPVEVADKLGWPRPPSFKYQAPKIEIPS